MKSVVLLGNKQTKRTIYFEKAAQIEGLPCLFQEWQEWKKNEFLKENGQIFVKLDPPVWESGCLEELEYLIEDYSISLKKMEEREQIVYLNTPSAIMELLDKRGCKEKLKRKKLPVTELVGEGIQCTEALLEQMGKSHIRQVFIKPVTGSGAAGVTAFRWDAKAGRMMLYTCAALKNTAAERKLVNTKKLYVLNKKKEIIDFLDCLFSIDCVVERWYPKANYNGYSYDLRAVIQDGSMDFLLARLSKGPITNLQLNNQPLDAKELKLSKAVMESIEEVCFYAAKSFPGLRSVGIDILLEHESLKPRIIEMNGQGDLLYQDIYNENRIYRHQARMMKHWLKESAVL